MEERTEEKAVIVSKGSYKGSPTITLKRSEDDRFPFTFGPAKARLVLAAFDDIKKFVAECDGEKGKKD